MELIFYYFLVFLCVLYAVKKKWELQDKLMKTKFKLLYKIGKCDFCFDFWVSVIVVFIVNSLPSFKYNAADLVAPFAVSGLWIIFKKLTNE